MGKLFKLQAEIIHPTTYQTIAVLGDYILPIVVNKTGTSSQSWGNIKNRFNFYDDKVDDVEILGYPTFNHDNADLTLYMPFGMVAYDIDQYRSANYKLLLRDKAHPNNYLRAVSTLNSIEQNMEIFINGTSTSSYTSNSVQGFAFPTGQTNQTTKYVMALTIPNSVWDGVSPLNEIQGNITFNIFYLYKDASDERIAGKYNPGTNANLTTFIKGLEEYVIPTDPYEQGGTSTTGGGTGNFDLSSDQIDVPNVPTLSAVDTGLVSLYTPTLAQLQDLARYLWNANSATIDWWKKLIANPLDLILGLSIVPVAVPVGATENVRVGLIDTGVAMTKASSQYVQVDCGALNVTEFYGAALDYLPFRKTSIYLPFIGTRTISTDDIMGKTVHVVYNVDLLSGALTAMIKCGDAVLYQYSGSCAMSIPLTGQTFTDMITSTIQLAAGIGATIASGGAAAGIVTASAANSVMSMKPAIERAGGVSGAAGQLAVMRPYLIGEIPRQSVPEHYNKYAGYPSNISAVLGDLSGYTEIETIHLSGINATKPELEEIETLLKGGVFI